MEDLFGNRKEEQRARESLLRYYSSECIAHGTYILTVVIALFTSLQFLHSIAFSNEISSLILATFPTIGIYFIGRTLFWGDLASTILWVKPASDKDTRDYLKRKLEQANVNLLIKLHWGCSKYVTENKISRWFSGLKLRLVALFILVYFILYFVLREFPFPEI